MKLCLKLRDMKNWLLTLLIGSSFAVSAQKKSFCDTANIKAHLKFLVESDTPRNFKYPAQLNKVADYISAYFTGFADTVYFQSYEVNGITYKNVICSFGTQHKKRIIVGAHYDVCGEMPGADDNASGVAGLLELSRILKDKKLNHRIDLVAFTLEEPPFFDTKHMGSFVHAASMDNQGQTIYGMISLEMIGFFKDTKNSQHFPYPFLKIIYGNKGNFITLVTKTHSGKFSKKFMRKFKRSKQIRTKKFIAPSTVVGVDLSDHLNYWLFGYSALMVTDTSFYRNANYHEPTDTLETLDLKRLSKVVDAVFLALNGL